MISVRSRSKADGAIEFAFAFALFALAAAALASCAPIAFSIATVFLFAGPHNWVEARYFLSRLPARFGKYKQFFSWSFGGIAVLMLGYIALMSGMSGGFFTATTSSIYFGAWNTLFILWIVRLIVLSGRWQEQSERGLALPFGFLAMAFALAFPAWFGLALVYLHPMIGCWILDCELLRSRPGWRRTYHICLAMIPFFLAAIWWTLHESPSYNSDSVLISQIVRHAGSQVMPYASSRMLVAMHTFLEMMHYGVWLIVIPLISAGWKNFQPVSIPIAHRSDRFKRLVPGILATSTFTVVVLWICFALNYSITRDVYFTLAMAHVLAEIPFLLKTIPK
ncbi:MAG TPA: hypothetical protein V6C89_01330 [Drouetiella sp.]|jgi:MFS family permease